jgi:single-strand DNA-binding protein
MFAQVTLVGNLGQDPEMRMTPSGKSVTSFSLAINEKRGETEDTVWWRISCWDKTAETVAQYTTKGKQVLVVGRNIKVRSYQDNKGETRFSLEATADTVRFLGPKGEATSEPAPGTTEDIPW